MEATNSSSPDGATYGSITAPINLGSGGGNSGGGAIKLTVSGETIVNGIISALPTNAGNPGSGGSIFLTTGTLTGTGSLSVNGTCLGYTGGSGGGRIAVILTSGNSFDNVVMTAYGASGPYYGAAGTIYKQTASQDDGEGTLVIDNNNIITTTGVVTTISTSTTDTIVGDIILQNKGNLTINADQTLTAQNTGTSLTINVNSVLNNLGTLILGGTYINNGTLTGYP